MNVFDAKEKLEVLRRKYDQLQDKCKGYQAENETLRERIYKIEHGERCEGIYCESCKNAIPGDAVEYLTSKGNYISAGKKTICSLSVHCPDFQRKEG